MVGRGAVWVPLLALLAVAFAGVAVDETLHTQEISFAVESVHGGEVLDVAFVVDISDDMTVSVDDSDVPYGLSNVQIMAVLTMPDGDVKQVAVVLELGIELEKISSSPLIHRTTIQARVVQIEGKHYDEILVREQVFDLHADGAVVVYELTEVTAEEGDNGAPAPNAGHHGGHNKHGWNKHGWNKHGGNKHGDHKHGGHHNNGQHDGSNGQVDGSSPADYSEPETPEDAADNEEFDECSAKFWAAVGTASEWLHSLPMPLRLLVTLLAGFAAGIVFVTVVRLLMWALTCGRVPLCPRKCAADKNAQANYALNIQAHSGAYVAVPLDEKAAKKAEEKASLV